MGKLNHEWVKASLEMADNERSKLSEREREIHGLSSTRLRCLINNLCAAEKCSYLEIGAYKGSTLIAAARGNDVKVVGVDSFLYDDREANKWAPEGFIWDNMKSQLEANINAYRLQPDVVNGDDISIIQSDFKTAELPKNTFSVCFFDVSPVNSDSYDAFFENILPALTQSSVVVFSQQSNNDHAEQLNEALRKHETKVNSQFSEVRISGTNADATKYYSGVRVLGFIKKAVAAPVKAPVKAATKPTSNTKVNNG
ncbi:class I SAM-dependent methyltransferase [bacterium]|nr:class I SAM-dependent methyltransferase [bacterium]